MMDFTLEELNKFIAYLEQQQQYMKRHDLPYSMINGIQVAIVDLKIERKKIESGLCGKK